MPVAVIENPDAVSPGLVSDIETQAQEVAYLAGVLAGKETKSGTVGIVVSGEPPTWNYMTVGFAEGLKAANADAKLLYSVIGEAAYDDAPLAPSASPSRRSPLAPTLSSAWATVHRSACCRRSRITTARRARRKCASSM